MLTLQDGQLEAAVVQAKGLRRAMEDRHVLTTSQEGTLVAGIFDGHCGHAVAELAAHRLLQLADEELALGQFLRSTHDQIGQAQIDQEHDMGGACAVLFQLRGEHLELANVGDAELVSVSESGNITTLTELHRLSNLSERTRVVQCGAWLGHSAAGGETHVVDPNTGSGLMPTRTLGDHRFQHVGIICDPYEASCQFTDGWLIAGCDGLWDVLPQDRLPELLEDVQSAELGAYRLALAAFDRGTEDNLTVIAVRRTKKGSGPATGALAARLGDAPSVRRRRAVPQSATHADLARFRQRASRGTS